MHFITQEEMLEMASSGSIVIHPRAVTFASKFNINMRILHSQEPGEGTVISIDKEESSNMEAAVVSGIANSDRDVQFTIRNIPNQSIVVYKILEPLHSAGIMVDVIIQNLANKDGSVDFYFLQFDIDDKNKVVDILDEWVLINNGEIKYEVHTNIAKSSISRYRYEVKFWCC